MHLRWILPLTLILGLIRAQANESLEEVPLDVSTLSQHRFCAVNVSHNYGQDHVYCDGEVKYSGRGSFWGRSTHRHAVLTSIVAAMMESGWTVLSCTNGSGLNTTCYLGKPLPQSTPLRQTVQH